MLTGHMQGHAVTPASCAQHQAALNPARAVASALSDTPKALLCLDAAVSALLQAGAVGTALLAALCYRQMPLQEYGSSKQKGIQVRDGHHLAHAQNYAKHLLQGMWETEKVVAAIVGLRDALSEG